MNHNLLRSLLMRNTQVQIPDVQTRLLPFQDMQLRFNEQQDPSQPFEFDGYAVRWDSINSHGEKFLKGAFTDYINAVKVGNMRCHMYYNHGYQLLYVDPKYAMRVGKWLTLEEDDIGLKVSGRITPGHSLGNDVHAMLADETIDGLSIAFFRPDPMDVDDKGDYVEIRRVSLYEISVCDEPSDRNARVTASDLRSIETEADLKNFLRRFNLDETASDELIQRVQAFGKLAPEPEPETDPLSWLDQV